MPIGYYDLQPPYCPYINGNCVYKGTFLVTHDPFFVNDMVVCMGCIYTMFSAYNDALLAEHRDDEAKKQA